MTSLDIAEEAPIRSRRFAPVTCRQCDDAGGVEDVVVCCLRYFTFTFIKIFTTASAGGINIVFGVRYDAKKLKFEFRFGFQKLSFLFLLFLFFQHIFFRGGSPSPPIFQFFQPDGTTVESINFWLQWNSPPSQIELRCCIFKNEKMAAGNWFQKIELELIENGSLKRQKSNWWSPCWNLFCTTKGDKTQGAVYSDSFHL